MQGFPGHCNCTVSAILNAILDYWKIYLKIKKNQFLYITSLSSSCSNWWCCKYRLRRNFLISYSKLCFCCRSKRSSNSFCRIVIDSFWFRIASSRSFLGVLESIFCQKNENIIAHIQITVPHAVPKLVCHGPSFYLQI